MIITKGFESEYSIIYPFEPTESLQYAAEEMKAYIFKMTGASLPAFQDNRHVEDKEIVIGYTNRGGYTEEEKEELGKEGFIIKTEGEKIFIIGSGVRGALYGVYSFLEEYCGVRFYTNDFEKVPTTASLEVPAIDCNKQVPQFFYRNSYWKSVTDWKISAKLKINGCHGRERFPKKIGGDVNYEGGFEHTIGWLSGQCPFGERAWHQPCLSDETVYNTVITNVRNTLSKNPEATLISITQNDGDSGACKCEKCKAINDREESEMGTMLSFVNRIAEELEDEFPNVMFDTFAYRFTRKPPKTIRPRKNVIVRLCSIEACFRHPIEECDIAPGHPDLKRGFKQDLIEWSAVAPNLTIWNYTTDFTNFPVLFFDLPTLRRNVEFFARYGAKGLFEQGNFASANGEFGELKGYILARLLWEPYMTQERYRALIKEFIMDFYGEGGKYIIEYFKVVEELSKDSHFGIYFDDASKYVRFNDEETELLGKKKFLALGEELFDKAESAAKNGFELANVRRSRIHLIDYRDFTIRDEINEAKAEGKSADELEEALIENNKKRLIYMRRYGVQNNREFHDIISLSEPDYKQHALLWNRPDEA